MPAIRAITQVPPFVVVLPMIPLVAAFLAAIIGKTRGISFKPLTKVGEVRAGITGAIHKQRLGTTISIVSLTIGLISGGFILAYFYGGPKPAPTTITVYLTTAGKTAISSACGVPVSSITGTAGSSPIGSEDIVVIPTPHSACGGQRLELTQKEVAAIK